MITIEEFRAKIRCDDPDDIVNDILLGDFAMHVSPQGTECIKENICAKFGMAQASINLTIVGSAKLGFSIIEKTKNSILLPRYRLFGPESDIDTAIVSRDLFESIWDDLSRFVYGMTRIPWDSGKLGDYMIYGWLKPNQFPNGCRVRKCDDWWDLFRSLSTDSIFDRHRVRGGLFYSQTHLQRYIKRGVMDCKNAEGGIV